MKMIVNWSLCDGNGMCALEAPDIFELSDDDELIVLKEDLDESDRESAEAAFRACPKRALIIQH